MSRRGHVRRLIAGLLLPVLAFALLGPAQAHAVEPPPELNFVCVDHQDNVLYAAGPHECTGKETLRRLPHDRPLHWCADHLGRLTEVEVSRACSARAEAVTIPTDGPVPVCARNILGGRTLSRGTLRMVVDLSHCDRDETGLVTPAAPDAVADSYTIDEDSRLVVPDRGVLDNDRDLTGQPLTAHLASGPTEGELELALRGGFTYDPRGRFDHLDEGASARVDFSYRADDGALRSAPATVTVTITGRNDRPVATDDVIRVDEDSALEVRAPGLLANDSDSEDHPLTTELLDGPDKGSLDLRADGGLRFDPRDDFQHLGAVEGETGSTTFAYVARDGSTASDAATVRVQVRGVNDAPVGGADRVSTDENTPVDISATQLVSNDSDAENQPLTVTDIVPPQPGHGVLTPLPGGGIRLDPNADSTDDDGAPDFDHLLRGQTAEVALTYRADDGDLRSDAVTVTITVHGRSAPTANDDSAATDEDHEIAIDVLGNDRLEDGELTVQTDGTLGQVTVEDGTVARYNPRGAFDPLADGATGVDSFRYTLTNDEGSSTGDVTVTLTGVNDAPVATDDDYQVEPGTPLNVPASPADGDCPCGVLATDTDVDTDRAGLTARLVSPPDRGRLILDTDGSFRFDPAGEFDEAGGETSFTYRVDDGSDESAVATVRLSVDSNLPPEFDSETEDGPDTYSFTVPQRDLGAWTETVSATDPDGDDVSYAVVTDDTGSFTVNDSGKVSVTEALALGTYRLDIEATDGRGGRDVATVTLHVVPQLKAVDDVFTGVGNTQVVGGEPAGTPYAPQAAVRVRDLLTNDSGVSGTVAPATTDTALGGTVTIEQDGSFVYAPPLLPASAWDGAAPQDRFTYTVEDDRVDEADATGSVTITLAEPVWYVDADALAPGTGTAWAPYTSLNSVSGAAGPDAPGQTIFLFGDADDPATPDVVERAVFGEGVVLEDQQRLVGHAAGLVVDGLDVVAAGPRPQVHGPEDGSAVSLASGNTVTGLDIGGVGNGVVGSGVGALTLHVANIATDGTPLELAGGSVDLQIDEVTARGGGARAELTNLGGSTRIGTVSLEAPGSALGVTGNAGDVEVTEVLVGGGTLEVHGNASGASVHVGSLVGEDVLLGADILGNRGTVTIEQVELTEVRGAGVHVADEQGVTSIGGGLISGASGTVTGALAKVTGDGSATDGRVELGADLALQSAAAAAGDPTGRALLITGVGEGGEVVVTGHLLDRGLGLRAVGVPGTVRLLGGADVRTSTTPALHVGYVDRLEIGGTVETIVSTIGGAPTLVMRHVGIAAAGARISQLDSADARTTAALIERAQADPAGPGLVIVDGSVTTPGTEAGEDTAGVDVGFSSGVTLQGLLIRGSAGDGVTVDSSSDVTLDGVTVTEPERTGVTASRTTNLLIDATTVRNAGTHGIWLHELQGLQRIRRSQIEDSGSVQLLVEDATASTAVQDTVVLESSVATGGAPEIDSIRVRATDDTSAPPADLVFRVSGDTPSGSIGGDTGLSAVADKGAQLGLDLRTFAVAGT
ncbi:MAG TPA: Ig-like domain-containing protein, partial [Nocardioidaceae bacterium]|nr:Ig-like domain-containing protein [Nocardioidaceae bacterium]